MSISLNVSASSWTNYILYYYLLYQSCLMIAYNYYDYLLHFSNPVLSLGLKTGSTTSP